jgi:hypothetical protein
MLNYPESWRFAGGALGDRWLSTGFMFCQNLTAHDGLR